MIVNRIWLRACRVFSQVGEGADKPGEGNAAEEVD